MEIRKTDLLGVSLAILAMLLFSMTYAFYKGCGTYLPNTHTIFFQSLFSWILILPYALKDGVKQLASPHLGKIALRTIFGIMSLYLITLALRKATLAEAVTLNNAAPLFIPLILLVWHRTAISLKLGIGLLIGFAGVWLILRPGFEEVQLSHLYAFLSAISSALLVIATRQIAHEPFKRILFYYFLIFWLVLLPFIFTGWIPFPPILWLYIVLAAISMILAQVCFTYSLRFATSQEVAPLIYTSVIFAGLIDWLIWKQTPDLLSAIGMLVVCVGGIMTVNFSQKKGR